MAYAVSPSDDTITKGQSGKFSDLLAAALAKSGLPNTETQQVLEQQGANLTAQFIALVRGQVDAVSEIIRRSVPVDRDMSPEAAISATGRTQYVMADVVASMPQGVDDTAEIIWIPLKKRMSNEEVVKKLAGYEMILVDPIALSAHNALEPDFAAKQRNFTLWQDAEGNWCYAAFYDWSDVRFVRVTWHVLDWDGDWWVAAVRK